VQILRRVATRPTNDDRRPLLIPFEDRPWTDTKPSPDFGGDRDLPLSRHTRLSECHALEYRGTAIASSIAPLRGRPNTGDKLRSSNMLGFVSFIPLLDGLVVPPNVVVPTQPRHASPALLRTW
jgi:hypothetical protein